ncbi:MAG: hypothetical protein GF334_02565 [Candidatus Altiarchaeales archaeon]|nr:hypothetical protein [Candidatus Altiarchaeales archaeon]
MADYKNLLKRKDYEGLCRALERQGYGCVSRRSRRNGCWYLPDPGDEDLGNLDPEVLCRILQKRGYGSYRGFMWEKAALCIEIVEFSLGKGSSVDRIEEEAVLMMDLPMGQIEKMVKLCRGISNEKSDPTCSQGS